MVFENVFFDSRRVVAFAKVAIQEIDATFMRMGSIQNSWTDFLVTRHLGVKSRETPPPSMIEVHCWPPVSRWIKVNTDGSATGAPGLIAAGGIFRDKWAAIKGCFHIKGGVGFAFEAELLAIIIAINIAHKREENKSADIMANGERTEGWWPHIIDDIKLAMALDMATHNHIRIVK
ncbi:uncharacterized protein LOC131008296 [Salvia miltiorrhiza]|uniref:uncharacterized protein LOC131008296 n=1 Tax=Salvia miltiorrhiza TaxID=226208 RepID=UPI0025AC2373|nr:uncharacterized protein LOC131008296 [Salvia miltiorrhiza]